MRFSVFSFAAACLALLATHAPAQAQGNLTLADCTGAECRCVLSNHTLEEWEVILDSDAPAGTVGIIIRDGGDHEWSSLTPEEIEVVLGGDAQCDTELFQDWFPEDGTWDASSQLVGATGIQGCSMAGTMMLTAMNQSEGPVQVVWDRVFDMNILTAAQAARDPSDGVPIWTSLDRYNAEASYSADGGVATYRARLLNPVLIVTDWNVSGGGCSISFRTFMRKIG